jgi:uncharacterized membrane protein YbhN (UPF0104 family)
VNKHIWKPILKYVLGFGLLGVVIWFNWEPANGQPGLAAALQKPIHPVPLVAASLICAASLLLTFVRWYLLVRAQDLPFTLSNALRLGMVGNYFNTFLPGAIGGDAIKAVFLAREQSRRAVAVATIILDRVLGLCGLIWVVAVLGGLFWVTGALDRLPATQNAEEALAVTGRIKGLVLTALGIAGASVLFWLWLVSLSEERSRRYAAALGRVRWVGPTLAEFWRALWMYRCRSRMVALAMALAMIGHLGFVLVFYLGALTLLAADAIPPLETHFLIAPVGFTFQAGIPSPGGVGGGELGFGKLYELVGAAFSAGVLASLVYRVINWGLGVLGYLVYLWVWPALPAAEKGQAEVVEDVKKNGAMVPAPEGAGSLS